MPLNFENVDLGSFGINEEENNLDTDLNATMSEAVKVNPDQQVRVNKLSQESGMPVPAVETNPDQVESKLNFDKINLSEMSQRSPNTAEYLVDYNNASIAHDDIDVLESIERVFDFENTFEGLGESIKTGFKQQVEGLAAAGVDYSPTSIDDIIPASALPIGMENQAQVMSRDFAAGFGIETDEELQAAKGEATEQVLTKLRELKSVKEKLQPEDLNLLEQGVRAGVESLANMAPGFGLMIASGGQAAPLLATMGVQTFGSSYADARADGLEPEKATWFAGIDAAIEVGTEILPAGQLENIITGTTKGLGKKALKFMIKEMGTEQLATLGQTINSYMFGLDEELEKAISNGEYAEAANIQVQRQAVTAIATVVAGGAQASIATSINKTINAVQSEENKKQQEYAVEQQTIDRLNENSEQSKLKQRDKESFKQFVEKADGENNSHVFIDGSQAALYLQGKTAEEIQNDPALTLLQEQYTEASALGVDVQIPVAEFATDMTGTETYDALRDSMTMSETTASPFRQEQQVQETQSYVKNLVLEAQESEVEYEQAQVIYETVRDQLVDSGRVNRRNASLMAQVVPAWATAQAKRSGKTVEQVYQDSGLLIEGPLTGEKARLEAERADLLTQTDLIESTATEVTQDGNTFKTGESVTFNYAHNTQSATGIFGLPDEESSFGRGFEPSGQYMTVIGETPSEDNHLPNIDYGTVSFNNPLVIEADGTGWKEKLSKDYGGVTGKELSKAVIADGYDGIVTTEKDHVSEVVNFQTFDESKALFQEATQPKNLIVTHNISEKGLEKADELGGLAAPSLAVVNTDVQELSGFGEITLIPKPEILDEGKVWTFDADIYSARQPRAEDVFDNKKVREFRREIEEANEETGLTFNHINSIHDLEDRSVFYAYLKSIGKAPKIKKVKMSPIARAVKDEGLHGLMENPKFIKAVTEDLKKQLDKFDATTEAEKQLVEEIAMDWFTLKPPEDYKLGKHEGREGVLGWAYSKDGEVVTPPVASKIAAKNRLNRYLRQEGVDQEFDFDRPRHDQLTEAYKKVRNAREGIDRDALRDDLTKKDRNKKLREGFTDWYTEKYESLVKSRKLRKGYQKYQPYTLDNVVREMTRTLQGGETGNYGAASIRAVYAKHLKNKKAVQARRDSFITKEEMSKLKDESNEKFFEFAETMKRFYKYDTESWGYGTSLAEAITDQDFSVFKQPARAKELVDEFGEYLAGLPTEYFEAKVQRAMDFSEFETALVPKGTKKGTVDRLRKHGLKVKRYDSNSETGRLDALKKEQKLLFQPTSKDIDGVRGYYDPSNSIIRLTEASDLSTFLHEFAHFMYEMEVDGNTDMLQSINNWYKRNSKDVAKEANRYAKKEFDAEKQLEQAAYHGSPHRFDKFTLDAMGTGEGAQAYGWGLYFAGDKEVAEWYRKSLSGVHHDMRPANMRDITGWWEHVEKIYPDDKPRQQALHGLLQLDDWSDINKVKEWAKEALPAYSKEAVEVSESVISDIFNPGQLYEVNIPEDDVMLHWDLPLSEQEMLSIYDNMQQTHLYNFANAFQNKWYDRNEKGIGNWDGQDLYVELSKELGSDKKASEYLNSLGIKGIKYEDGNTRNKDGEKSYNYVIFDDEAVNVLEKFYQGGQPSAPSTPDSSITPEDVVTFLDNKTTGDKAKDSAIRRAVHEQFARGFETYLMEGKAPSIELRNAFRTFARWLSQVYKALKGDLDVNVDAEMRQVFDRLLATEEQIAAAEARARFEPMFTDAAMAGMTEEQFQQYQKDQEKVKDKQSETLRDKMIKQLTRQTKKWWKEEKSDIVDEQIDELKKEKVYIARKRLTTPGEIKIDFAMAKELAGEVKTNKKGVKSTVLSPKLRKMTAKEHRGVHPDEAAAVLGYESGSELLNDLINAPKIDDVADTRAEAIMVERHGDILTDGTIERAADDAVRNEERGKLMLKELKTIARDTPVPNLELKTIKDIAYTRIGRLSFREIFPAKYHKAEIKAAREAAVHLAEGNKHAAADAKMRQVMNYYLGLAATEAKNDTIKIVDFMSRYRKKKVREEIQKAGNDYWNQLAKLLSRFEFRKTATLKSVDINTWAKQQLDAHGDEVFISTEAGDEGFIKHWKNVPYDQLIGVSDTIKSIEHVARRSNEITLLQDKVNFAKLVKDWTTHIRDNKSKTFKTKADRDIIADVEDIKDYRWAMSQLTKIPFMASWLDGGERTGLSYDLLVNGFRIAFDEKQKLLTKHLTPVLDILDNLSKKNYSRYTSKYTINGQTLYGHQIIAVALNTGNESNLKKLLLGEGWADPNNEAEIAFENQRLQDILTSFMTKEDWNLVQTIWDEMDKLYPMLEEVTRKGTGITPGKIEASTISTPFGEYAGGYYPVVYSRDRSHKADLNEERKEAQLDSMFGATMSLNQQVTAGATNERTGYYAPIKLNMDVVSNHFEETIHYITHYDTVKQVNRLIQSTEVADAISESLGEHEYKRLAPWLNDIAKDGKDTQAKGFISEFYHRMKFGATLTYLGFKASTGLMQVLGLYTTAGEVGFTPTMKGIFKTVGKSRWLNSLRRTTASEEALESATDFAMKHSKVMNHRAQTMDREIRDAQKRLSKAPSVRAQESLGDKAGAILSKIDNNNFVKLMQEASMKHIAVIQQNTVDVPTWHAAYDKMLEESAGDEQAAIKYADQVVDNIQGSGTTYNMAEAMRDKRVAPFTMFMTFFSSLGNLSRDLKKGLESGKYSYTDILAKSMFFYVLPVMTEMFMRGELGKEDDEEDEEYAIRLLTKIALYPTTSVPLVRDILNVAGSDFGFTASPVYSLVGKGVEGFFGMTKAALSDEKEITVSQVKNFSKFVAAASGVPGTAQIWATMEHIYDAVEEGEDLTVRELLFGPERD